MKKILCPTDFSDAAISGISYAAKLAKRIQADLTLLNVVALTDLFPEEVLMGEQANTAVAKSRLDAQCREVTKVFKVSCYSDVEATPGSTSKVISKRASDYDLIVMGSNGIDELSQFISGSQTYQVIRKSKVPVIMVPEQCIYSEIEHLVYAYDFYDRDIFPLTQLVIFSKLTGCEITVLQLNKNPLNETSRTQIDQLERAIINLYEDEVKIKFESLVVSETIDGIDDYMEKSKSDMLALCSEHHGFLSSLFHRSVIKSITGKSKYPVFVFHS